MKHIFVDTSVGMPQLIKQIKTTQKHCDSEYPLIAEHVLDVVWIDQYLAQRGWDVFEQYNVDKQWSFTDCTSYVIIKELGITEVFAFDHHFEQMGFILLPSLPR